MTRDWAANEFERLTAALAERYRVERELGRGGMATVYLAEDLKHHRQVALKVLKRELAAALGPERFLREIEIAARLTHPHIVPLYDSGEADGLLYYVMPFVEGESLRDRLERQKQLSLHETVEITRAVADALSYAHSMGIVHRDIKPENILFEAGHAVVTDFGIARAITEAGGEHLTETGIAVGTPAYMSPEQAAGARELDARSDIYALGCVFYELLAGQPPFTGPSAQAVLARHSLDPVPRLRTVRETVPEALEAVVLRALAKVPADRFATAREFAEALEESARVAEVTGPLRSIRRRRAIPLAVAVAIAVVGVGGWWALARPGAERGRIESLAVLPLKNLMGDPEQEYFVEGMHEALITELSRISALKVISRTSTMRYRDTDKPLPQVARELNVDGVIEGSVLREGDRVRITVQLIEGRSDRHVWAETFDRELRGVLALHSELARAVAAQVQISLTPKETTRLASARLVDPEAYQLYLKGNFQLQKITEDGFRAAIAHYQEVIRRDSTYAPAYAGLAIAYTDLGGWHSSLPPGAVHAKALEAALGAVERDPTLAEAHIALAGVRYHFEWDWAGAGAAYRRGMELNPSGTYARIQSANYLTAIGGFDESAAISRLTVQLDPLSPAAYNELAFALELPGHDSEALEQYQKGLDLVPDFAQSHLLLAMLYVRKNRFEDALRHAERAMGLLGATRPPAPLGYLGYVYARAGRREQALSMLDELETRAQREYVPPSAQAHIYLGLGRTEQALEWLRRAQDQHDVSLVWLKVWWVYDPLRAEPRFQELVRRMNYPN